MVRNRTSETARRWAEQLAAWAVPEEILAAAPESPYGFDPTRFARAAAEAAGQATPSRGRALSALPTGGSVLDVGCGGGAAGLALVPSAGLVVGVDSSPRMLDAFARRASTLGVEHRCVEGAWPEVAPAAEVADVVVCHHVVYNVPDLAPFLEALTARARVLVVVELTAEHPIAWTRDLWRSLHGLQRPHGPVAADAIAVARELGLAPVAERWDKPFTVDVTAGPGDLAHVRRRLCLPPSRDRELAAALRRFPPPRSRPVFTLSWPGRA